MTRVASLLAATPGLWEDGDNLDQSSAVAAALLLNPVLDWADTGPDLALSPPSGRVQSWLGGSPDAVPDVYARASTLRHVNAATPPTLLLHGTADRLAPYAQSVAYDDALKAAGGVAELFTAAEAGHGFFNGPPWYEQTLAAMLAFAAKLPHGATP